jgi:hypothetical protein
MYSTFHELPEQDKKLFAAKILHEVNYSQESYNLISRLLNYWEHNQIVEASYFNQPINTTKKLNYEHRTK